MNIYIGNLSFATSSADLKTMFAVFGQVQNAAVITDLKTNRSKGFGFVEMPVSAEADLAITTLNGKRMDGRNLKVDPAIQSEIDDNAIFGLKDRQH